MEYQKLLNCSDAESVSLIKRMTALRHLFGDRKPSWQPEECLQELAEILTQIKSLYLGEPFLVPANCRTKKEIIDVLFRDMDVAERDTLIKPLFWYIRWV